MAWIVMFSWIDDQVIALHRARRSQEIQARACDCECDVDGQQKPEPWPCQIVALSDNLVTYRTLRHAWALLVPNDRVTLVPWHEMHQCTERTRTVAASPTLPPSHALPSLAALLVLLLILACPSLVASQHAINLSHSCPPHLAARAVRLSSDVFNLFLS
jgi:hypothetical protein